MITKTKKGDIVELADWGEFDAIAHGCNCFCRMGSGVALAIARNWRDVREADNSTQPGDAGKLGQFSVAKVYRLSGSPLYVFNLYTQYRYGYDGARYVDYDALKSCFVRLNDAIPGRHLGIPKIGAGLAGGDWPKIAGIINSVTPDIEITLVELDGSIRDVA